MYCAVHACWEIMYDTWSGGYVWDVTRTLSWRLYDRHRSPGARCLHALLSTQDGITQGYKNYPITGVIT